MLGPTNASAYNRLNAANSFFNLTNFFVDDFTATKYNINRAHLTHVSRVMLHGNHSILPQQEVAGNQGEDPISQNKLKQKEGVWHTNNYILGWIFDGSNYTIQIVPDKCQKIAKLIKKI